VVVRRLVLGIALALIGFGADAAAPAALIGTWRGTVQMDSEPSPLVIAIGERSYLGGPPGHEGYAPATVTQVKDVVIIEVPSIDVKYEVRLSSDGRTLKGIEQSPDPFAELPQAARPFFGKPAPPPAVVLTRTSADPPSLPGFLSRLAGTWEGAVNMGAQKPRMTLDVGEHVRLQADGGGLREGAVFIDGDEVVFSFGSSPVFIGKLSADGQKITGEMGPGVVTFPVEFVRQASTAGK
jgi:hypothetical protein